MPVINNQPTAQPAAFKSPSALDNYVQVAQDFGNSFSQPLTQALHRLGVFKSTPVDLSSLVKPSWESTLPVADRLRVFGAPLPQGAVLTYCQGSEKVGYRAYPLSDVTPVSISLALYTAYKQEREKGADGTMQTILTATYDVKPKKQRFQGAPALSSAMAQAHSVTDSTKNQKSTARSIQSQVTAKTQAELDLAATQASIFKLRKKVGKVYLGDPEPRTAELRFVVHDVISLLPGGGQQVDANRYEVLERLRAQFCANPLGGAEYTQAYTAQADAARLTARAVAGHLLQLSSPGLDPYGVVQWLVADFQHVEVDSANVIAVRVKLIEFISALSANVENDQFAPEVEDTTPKPDPITRPSYIGKTLPGATF